MKDVRRRECINVAIWGDYGDGKSEFDFIWRGYGSGALLRALPYSFDEREKYPQRYFKRTEQRERVFNRALQRNLERADRHPQPVT
jgi:hypothetical protein